MSITGSSSNISERVFRVLPKGWFKWAAPIRNAIVGGLSDAASWCYGLIGYARAQTRLSTAYGVWLDVWAFDFLGRYLVRNGAPDAAFRALIKATVLQERVTRKGMINAITALTGKAPIIFEPWNTYDTGGYSNAKAGQVCGQFGYGVGQGGYGSMVLPAQTFIQVDPGVGAGIPDVGGYGTGIMGYGVGASEYAGPTIEESGVTPAMIYDLINKTKPTGSTCWVLISSISQGSLIMSEGGANITADNGSQLIAG
ncbi:hypothetical protein [Bradyrhizobium sp. Tv2a-2]|uniref:hypothetical protein n=1 Tax=Bradyrhizobium sp. Tv2a-2 TaxID=113395 RepID=UPI0003FD6605|nr:hypothetical protein [Bradyrhizobium sp. Tv2a-2]